MGTVFIECLKSERDSSHPLLSYSRGVGPLPGAAVKLRLLAATPDHDDAAPLTVLFSVLALSLMGRTPESMGEETVQSTREGGAASVGPESVVEVGAESCTG